jgi:enoyl-CoA hydratase/carnithine racemase
MIADVLSTNVPDGIAVITLGSPKRIYFDTVHETVSGKALDRAMEIERRLSSFPSESVAYIKRLVRSAGTGTGTRTKSLLEIMHRRTCTRVHAFL